MFAQLNNNQIYFCSAGKPLTDTIKVDLNFNLNLRLFVNLDKSLHWVFLDLNWTGYN